MPGFLFRKPELIPKTWGYEICICSVLHDCFENGYACKTLTLLPCRESLGVDACSIHYHVQKNETFYVTRGTMFLQIYVPRPGRKTPFEGTVDFLEPKGFIMYPGTVVTLEPYTAHRFWTQAIETTVIEASTPDDPQDSYRLVESGRQLMDVRDFVEVRPDGIPLV